MDVRGLTLRHHGGMYRTPRAPLQTHPATHASRINIAMHPSRISDLIATHLIV